MNQLTKLTVLLAVIGTVGILHAMADLLATPGTSSSIQMTQHEDQTKELTITREVAPLTNAELSPSQIVNNIYNTETGSFYFITLPNETAVENISDTASHVSSPSIAPVYYQAQTVDSQFDVTVTGPIVRTRLTQTFENNAGIWQDGIYVFPLPNGAAVDSLIMRVGGREIIGEIQPKQKAQQMFEQAKTAGKSASLVQQIRPDIFKNQLSNIPPNEAIVVEIEYQQLLKFSDMGYELRLPTGVKPKYYPPDRTDRETQGSLPKSIEDRAISAPVLHPTEIAIGINMGLPIINIESLHHQIETQQYNSVEYEVKTTESQLKDASFVLRWALEEKSHTQLSHIQERSDTGTYGMISMLAPSNVDVHLKRDVTFILDTSGSMVGSAIEQAKSALAFAIEDLAYTDRFNIVEFNSKPTALWGASSTASDANKMNAVNFLQQLEADGGTEMLSALELAFKLNLYREVEGDRIHQFIFITDGSVGNESDILAKIKQDIGSSRLFTVGIGNAPNGYFMDEAAIAGKGLSVFIEDLSHVEQEMKRFLDKVKHPSWTDVSVNTLQANSTISYFPKKLPDLYAGEPFFLFYQANSQEGLIHSDALTVSAKSALPGDFGGIVLKDINRKLAPSYISGHVSISKQWAHEKIQHLMRMLNTSARPHRSHESTTNDYQALEKYVQENVTDLALKHSLVTQFTSLIAIDHEADRALAERTKTTQQTNVDSLAVIKMQHLPSTSADVLFTRILGAILILLSALLLVARRSLR